MAEIAILSLLQGCNSLKRLCKIHANVFITGLQHHPAISNKLLNFCAVSISGSLSYAQLLFHQIENPQTQDWNSIIRGFAQSPSPIRAIHYYNEMISASLSRPDTFTFSFVLKACQSVNAIYKVKEVHASIIRSGYEKDVIVCTNLIKSYAREGSIEIARKVFDDMPERDLVCWNSMISCYSQAGFHQEALRMYSQMRNEKVDVDGFTLVGLLSSCAHLGALNFGIWIHKFASENRLLENNIYIGNALIDMYAKCGNLDLALSVFENMRRKDVFTWNSMVVGYGMHGRGDEAVSFFKQMLYQEVRPNSITFLGLLCGCSHQGLVKEGVEYLEMMSSMFKLKPGVKHYGCMVDLFGRAGKLEKALEIICSTCSENDPVLWRILLGSCKIHKNVEIGEIAMRNLMHLGATNAGDCMLLATIYGQVKDAYGIAKMRRLVKSKGIKTTPGCSWIEVGEQVHKFVVDDKSHPNFNEINKKLREVIYQAIMLGCMDDSQGYYSTGDGLDTSNV